MVEGADLQLFLAFEIIERQSGCKSWWLNSPKLHLCRDSYCISYIPGFFMQPDLEVQNSPWGTRARALGSVPSARGKPIPWCPPEDPVSSMEQLYWANLWEGFALGFSCGSFRLSLKRYSNFIRNLFSPTLFRSSRSLQVRKSVREKCFALGDEAYFSWGNFSFTTL